MKKLYIFFILIWAGMLSTNALNNPTEPEFLSDYPHLQALCRNNPQLLAYIIHLNDSLDMVTGVTAFRHTDSLRRQMYEKSRAARVRQIQLDTTVNVEVAGSLTHLLSNTQKSAITGLKLTGNIDARDFKTLRDSMPSLSSIDISNVTVIAYTGTNGTAWGGQSVSYPANSIPRSGLRNISPWNYYPLETISLPKTITAIGDSAFYSLGYWTGPLIIPPSVTSIGNSAFEYCSHLTDTLKLPDSVTRIGKNAFSGCEEFKRLRLSESLDTISNGAFDGCWGISGEIVIPQRVKYIGASAFNYNIMTNVIFPDSLDYIGEGAFATCKYLAGPIVIPPKVTAILDGTFSRCARLKGITFPNSLKYIGNYVFTMGRLPYITLPDSLISIGDAAFAFTNISGSLILPNSIISIGGDAFYSNNLSSITIPASLTNIGSRAFYGNCNVSSIYSKSPVPAVLNASPDVFYCINKSSCILYVPTGSTVSYRNAYEWKDFANIVEMNVTGLPGTDSPESILYPNPITTGFYLNAGEGTVNLTLHTVEGKQVMSVHTPGNSYIPTGTLPAGMYIVRVNKDGVYSESKLIKK